MSVLGPERMRCGLNGWMLAPLPTVRSLRARSARRLCATQPVEGRGSGAALLMSCPLSPRSDTLWLSLGAAQGNPPQRELRKSPLPFLLKAFRKVPPPFISVHAHRPLTAALNARRGHSQSELHVGWLYWGDLRHRVIDQEGCACTVSSSVAPIVFAVGFALSHCAHKLNQEFRDKNFSNISEIYLQVILLRCWPWPCLNIQSIFPRVDW